MPIRKATFLVLCLWALIGCGGGSGGPGPSLLVAPHQVTVTGMVNNEAPIGTVNLTILVAGSGTQYYVAYQYTTHSIRNISFAPGLEDTFPVSILFIDPTTLGPGTYNDTVEFSIFTDPAGAHPIAGSPQTVTTTYTVTSPVPPTITSLVPGSVTAGGPGFTLTVNGTLFSPQTEVLWNGSYRELTGSYGGTQLAFQVSASDIASAGNASVTVSNAISGGGVSAPATFTIGTPALGISAVSPTAVPVGGPAFTLTVMGAQFTAASAVQWNGSARATTYVSPTLLTAQILASDITAVGPASVTVLNPAGQGGLSGTYPVTIAAADAVAMQIDTGHSGSATFPGFQLPAASRWSVTLDGPPSYPLIAQGKVYVTVAAPGGTELVALDQATGAAVWGPLPLTGWGNAAYDNGKVFVLTSGGNTGPVSASVFDAGTGAPGWSALIPGEGVGAPPTAVNGFVYANDWAGTLTALYESSGAVAWSQEGGEFCSPAVTPGGLFVSYPDTAAAFNPTTGAVLWNDDLGGNGIGGATPVVANGLVYAPDGSGPAGGEVFQASTGALVGTYAADNLPAIAAQNGYFLQSGTLRGIQLSSGTILWSFPGDGKLVTSPLVINSVVFIGSSSGNLYGLDAATGAQVWQMTLTAPLPRGAGWSAEVPLSGLAAGDGLLVVPAGNTLTAYQMTP